MTDTIPEPTAPAAPVEAPPEKPPWGDNFDAEKAWNLVQNLRQDKEKLSARPVLTPEQQKQLEEYTRLEQASKSESQRLQEDAAKARLDADTAQAEATRLRVAIEHRLDKEDIGLLGAGTEEEIRANAARIAELRAAAAGPKVPAPNPAQGSSASGPALPGQLSKEDLQRMHKAGQHDEIAKARAEGRFDQLLGAGQ